MDVTIKDLVANIRRLIPEGLEDSYIKFTFTDSYQGLKVIKINGAPPNDRIILSYVDEPSEYISNWGAVEVQSLIDSPDNILNRQAVLKDYDNKRGRKPKES